MTGNVNPVIHNNYDGKDMVLPKDNTQVIKVSEHPDLRKQKGNDIITADGTTLLGANNKAGIAELLDAANYLISHPEVKHGTIKILFTPDEEIGRGVDKLDLKKLGADFGYAIEAIEMSGMDAIKGSIRGGTDGSRLSFMELPCPNLFAGGHAFHSKQEWVSVQDMHKAVETIIHLCNIVEEKA